MKESLITFSKESMKQQMVSVITKKIEKLFTFAYPENPYGKESWIF